MAQWISSFSSGVEVGSGIIVTIPILGCGLQGSTALIYYLEDSEIK